jgi:hypothetical protein
MPLISLEKMHEGKLCAAHFLLIHSSHAVMGAPVCLLRESRCVRLVHVVDQWARPSLSLRVVPVAGGSQPFTILGQPLTIRCMVHEPSSLCLSDGLSYIVPGINSLIWPFHRLLCRNNNTLPRLFLSHHLSSFSREMTRGDNHWKHPRNDGSHHDGGSPPPH